MLVIPTPTHTPQSTRTPPSLNISNRRRHTSSAIWRRSPMYPRSTGLYYITRRTLMSRNIRNTPSIRNIRRVVAMVSARIHIRSNMSYLSVLSQCPLGHHTQRTPEALMGTSHHPAARALTSRRRLVPPVRRGSWETLMTIVFHRAKRVLRTPTATISVITLPAAVPLGQLLNTKPPTVTRVRASPHSFYNRTVPNSFYLAVACFRTRR